MSYLTFHSKKIFYKEAGHGKPLVMLHGDTASSVMFEFLLPLYQENFRVILLDFLGNGQSDRVSHFPADLWSSQTVFLCSACPLRSCRFPSFSWEAERTLCAAGI